MTKNYKRPYRKGEVLLEEEPFVFALSNKYVSERCDHCFASDQLMRCGGCSFVHYCNRNCQRKGWLYHRFECPNIKKVSPHRIPDAARLLARIIIKLNRGGGKEKSYYSEKEYRVFEDLMSHFNEMSKDELKIKHITCLRAVLKDYIGEKLLPDSVELLSMYGKMIINTFSILDVEMINIGSGIYLAASIIDHSCSPNAVAVFEGTKLYIRTTIDLPYLDWSKVYISYIDLLDLPEVRQKSLQTTYYFKCQCERCLDIEELNCMTSTVCQNEDCKACIPGGLREEILKCPNCDLAITQETKDKFNEIAKFTKEKLEQMKDTAYLDVCRVCLKRQEDSFHSLNIYTVKALEHAWDACISLQNWDSALEYGEMLMEPILKYFGDYDPLKGIFLLKMAKLAVTLGRDKEARRFADKAAKVLIITHGTKHTLVTHHLLGVFNEICLG